MRRAMVRPARRRKMTIPIGMNLLNVWPLDEVVLGEVESVGFNIGVVNVVSHVPWKTMESR